ncbi:hypothetical protein D9619_002394 [Psilocybe cf. subviscida]|uniref:F-box domain-containing protein n=1 Tax=Psilocybe cf. subviscida TaxID=2480587 RepID=A0A8H5AWA9_9AGAR|nr:hypothetical protein D9619_002394 [Psilocybe cf. subviscida]
MALCHMCRGSGMLSETPCSGKPLDLRCAPCTELADLDKKIAELQARRLAVLSNVNREHDPLANHLPIEICAEIFQQSLPRVDFFRKANTADSMPVSTQTSTRISSVPLLTSQVCRTWRAICHSTPRLWTVLTLYLAVKSGGMEHVAASLEWAWAARAGASLPLTIILFEGDVVHHLDKLTSTRRRSIFGLIATHAPRLCYLQATASSPALEELCRVYRDRSKLKTLRVFAMDDDRTVYVDNGPKFCPTGLCISRAGWRFLGIDTSVLTHAEAIGLLVLDCVALIENSPVLVSCTLSSSSALVSTSSLPSPANNPPRIHSCLKYLHISYSDCRIVTPYILDTFDFPSLESLSLQPPRRNQLAVFDAVCQHLHRSGSSVRTLLIGNLWLGTVEEYSSFSELLNAMRPTIHSLTLSTINSSYYRDSRKQHLSSLFESVLPRLLNLRSFTICSPTMEWPFVLRTTLQFSLSIVTANERDLSVTLWSPETPLDVGSSSSRTAGLAFTDYASLEAADIQHILDTMEHHRIRLEIKYARGSWPTDVRADFDVSEEVTAAFGVLLESSRERERLENSTNIVTH